MITPEEKYNLDKNTERARERDAFWWNGDLKPSTKPAMKYIMSNKMSFKSCLLFISHTKFDVVLLCSCAELPLVFLVFKERNELNMYMYRRTARSVTMVFCKKKQNNKTYWTQMDSGDTMNKWIGSYEPRQSSIEYGINNPIRAFLLLLTYRFL